MIGFTALLLMVLLTVPFIMKKEEQSDIPNITLGMFCLAVFFTFPLIFLVRFMIFVYQVYTL